MLRITEFSGPRFDLALERLRDGHAFSFEDLTFWLAPDAHLEISINSSWRPDNVTEQKALERLDLAQNVYRNLCAGNADFAAVAGNKSPRFILAYDYGSGSVELARLADGIIIWAKGFVPATQGRS